jgi:hypothetical protein
MESIRRSIRPPVVAPLRLPKVASIEPCGALYRERIDVLLPATFEYNRSPSITRTPQRWREPPAPDHGGKGGIIKEIILTNDISPKMAEMASPNRIAW